MWRWVLGGFIVIVLIVVTVSFWDDHERRVAVVAENVQFAKAIATLRTEYPVGTSRESVVAELKTRNVAAGAGTELLVPLGKETSTVWYCSFFAVYANFKFVSANGDAAEMKLQSIDDERRGECL